jgi:hypothetical protein
MGVSGQRHATGKTRFPEWDPGSVWMGAENLASTGIRSPKCAVRTKSLYRLSCSGPRQAVLKHQAYQNKWLENIERIPKMRNAESRIFCIKNSRKLDLWPRICCNQCVSCRGWRERHTEIWMDQFYLLLKEESNVACALHTQKLYLPQLKAAFVHCYLAETDSLRWKLSTWHNIPLVSKLHFSVAVALIFKTGCCFVLPHSIVKGVN